LSTATGPSDHTRKRLELLPVDRAREELDAGVRLIDVREQNEWDDSHLAAATHIPQGELIERIDEVAPDRSERLLLHCRTDNRSSRMAQELAGLGYENVAVIEGGILAWEQAGLPTESGSGLTAEQRMRYSRHTLLPEVGVDGQLELLNSKVLLLGAGGLGAPSALYLAAAGVGTLGIVDDDVVDESNLQRQVIHSTERVGVAKTASALDPPLRRADLDLRAARGAVLPLPVPGAAAPRAGTELRRERRPRRDGRGDGTAAGQRGDQAGGRHRRAADRAAAPLRVAGHPVHRAQGEA